MIEIFVFLTHVAVAILGYYLADRYYNDNPWLWGVIFFCFGILSVFALILLGDKKNEHTND